MTTLPNNAVERTAGSHSLAAAAHCERWAAAEGLELALEGGDEAQRNEPLKRYQAAALAAGAGMTGPKEAVEPVRLIRESVSPQQAIQPPTGTRQRPVSVYGIEMRPIHLIGLLVIVVGVAVVGYQYWQRSQQRLNETQQPVSETLQGWTVASLLEARLGIGGRAVGSPSDYDATVTLFNNLRCPIERMAIEIRSGGTSRQYRSTVGSYRTSCRFGGAGALSSGCFYFSVFRADELEPGWTWSIVDVTVTRPPGVRSCLP